MTVSDIVFYHSWQVQPTIATELALEKVTGGQFYF